MIDPQQTGEFGLTAEEIGLLLEIPAWDVKRFARAQGWPYRWRDLDGRFQAVYIPPCLPAAVREALARAAAGDAGDCACAVAREAVPPPEGGSGRAS
ncbi:MAG: hypothetical protein J7M19_06145 [Planctomycetes bacterium]|nr:hypothetical protein [Planctomycetota bacterium]